MVRPSRRSRLSLARVLHRLLLTATRVTAIAAIAASAACGGRTALELPGPGLARDAGPTDLVPADARRPDGPGEDGSVPDAQPPKDARPPGDAFFDAGGDLAPFDAQLDALVDAPFDAVFDAPFDGFADLRFDVGADLGADRPPPPPEGARGFLAIQMLFVQPLRGRLTRLPAAMTQLVNAALTADGFEDIELLVRLESTTPGAPTTVIVCEAVWLPGFDCRPDRPVAVAAGFIGPGGVLITEPLTVSLELIRADGRRYRLTLHDWTLRGRIDLADDWRATFRASATVAELCQLDLDIAGCGVLNLLDVADGPLQGCGGDGSASLARCQPAIDPRHAGPNAVTADGEEAYALRGAATLRRVVLVGQ